MRFSTSKDIEIMNLFKSKNIITISDLTIEYVAHVFNAHIEFHDFPSRCNYVDDFAVIYLNRQQPDIYIRQDFFHELVHYIQDFGDQRKMDKDLRRYQESRMNRFALYASMPRHIFEPLMLENRSLETLIELFELPQDLITARIDTIRRARERFSNQMKIAAQNERLHSKSLQPGLVYDSTTSIVKQLANQVGEENLNYEVKRLLRGN